MEASVASPSSPSGRIPTELLSDIFLKCTHGVMDNVNTIHTPLLLSQICVRWRNTALATPRLWSRLFLNFKSAASPVTLSQLNLVQAWLARSSACPLTIYVFWEGEEETIAAASHPVLDALAEHSERWKAMFFYMPYAAFKSLTRIRKRLPLLAELSLGAGDEPSGLIGKLDIFADAPRLQSLECMNFSPLIFKFPWSQLTSIPMMAVDIDECMDVLLQTSNLVQAGFVFMNGFPSVYGQRIRLRHVHIRQFTIMTPPANETVDLRGLFPQLDLPHLEELMICNLRSPFYPEFVRFLARLRSLRTLHLRKTSLADHQLAQGLAHLPSLTKLIVHSAPRHAPTVTHHLLSALTWRHDGKRPMLLPALRDIELTIDYNVSEDFVAMVLSRVLFEDNAVGNYPARLETIRIRPTEDLGERTYTSLAEIASYGVEVSVEDLN